MIRTADVADIRAIARLGKAFHAEAGWADIAGYSIDDCAASLAGMIESDDAIILVAEENGAIVGMAGGVMFPLYFNAAHRSGQELFWWVEPSFRRGVGAALLTALEVEARERGCSSWAMIALDKVNPEATGRLYRRRGYRAAEHSWIRRL